MRSESSSVTCVRCGSISVPPVGIQCGGSGLGVVQNYNSFMKGERLVLLAKRGVGSGFGLGRPFAIRLRRDLIFGARKEYEPVDGWLRNGIEMSFV